MYAEKGHLHISRYVPFNEDNSTSLYDNFRDDITCNALVLIREALL